MSRAMTELDLAGGPACVEFDLAPDIPVWFLEAIDYSVAQAQVKPHYYTVAAARIKEPCYTVAQMKDL